MNALAADRWYQGDRLAGLRRFAVAITALNVLGHLWLGFEPAWSYPVAGVLAAYATEVLLELVDALAMGRRPRFLSSERPVDFLLSAHISGMAVSMLLYANQRVAPIAFAASAAIASKSLLRLRIDGKTRHVFNPSNFGIALTLLLFPSVGIAPPYQFTENLGRIGDWALPAVIVCLGSFLNARFTHRVPLIAAWVSGFALQALARHWLLGSELSGAFMPMTGMAFLLFTFYMVTDPATTPSRPLAQIAFGLSVAAAYGILMGSHVVFGLFFGLALASTARAGWLAARALARAGARVREPAPAPALRATGVLVGRETEA
jgi:hypothetical protein